jgi:hypothetical protein
MYLDAGMLDDALEALSLASHASGRGSRPLRYLGEVLLRQGEAQRALATLQRAMEHELDDSDTRLWLSRAQLYVALEKRVGAHAVAAEIARTLPHRPSVPPLPFSSEPPPSLSQPQRNQSLPMQALDTERPGARGASPLPDVAAIDATRRIAPPAPRVPRIDFNSGEFVEAEDEPTLDRSRRPELEEPATLVYAPRSREQAPTNGAAGPDASREPSPDIVLQELYRVGLHDPPRAGAMSWEAGRGGDRRTWRVLLISTLCLAVAGFGAARLAARNADARGMAAAAEQERLAAALGSADGAELAELERSFKRLALRESMRPELAALWLRQRVLASWWSGAPSSGLSEAAMVAKRSGVTEPNLVYARLASLEQSGDLLGAVELVNQSDAVAHGDAIYQLAAGIALERVGHPDAAARFALAKQLEPGLVLAQAYLGRHWVLEREPRDAEAWLNAQKSDPAQPWLRALRALAWALDSTHPRARPAESRLAPADELALPAALSAVPPLVAATDALERGERQEALEHVARASATDCPPLLRLHLSALALRAGDPDRAGSELIRATLNAGVSPRAIDLGARIALSVGELGEANMWLTRHSAPTLASRVTAAALAYEALDAQQLTRVAGSDVAGAGDPARMLQILQGRRGADLSVAALAPTQVFWGELMAVDEALDAGQIEWARARVSGWGAAEGRSPWVVRAARLERLSGQPEHALELTEAALSRAAPTPRLVIEHVLALVESGRPSLAAPLVARHASLLGLSAPYLETIVALAVEDRLETKRKLTAVALPSPRSPLLTRVLAARALKSAGDRRLTAFVEAELRRNPTLTELAELRDARR